MNCQPLTVHQGRMVRLEQAVDADADQGGKQNRRQAQHHFRIAEEQHELEYPAHHGRVVVETKIRMFRPHDEIGFVARHGQYPGTRFRHLDNTRGTITLFQ